MDLNAINLRMVLIVSLYSKVFLFLENRFLKDWSSHPSRGGGGFSKFEFSVKRPSWNQFAAQYCCWAEAGEHFLQKVFISQPPQARVQVTHQVLALQSR
jgi:hypothetical protein